MSDERYELKGKIGQGGVGAVYRAFDNNLNREVAIKRVLPGGGYESDEEATKAMLHEATSLCSVQHPHIVTVFDAGVDSDGPYVVMELLSGRTLDEMVERGTLTYDDFREVALQSQEALIAAQDLNLVHRDIKPTNMMVTWLPSGRFQVKLVDFGLAKFSPQPSLQTIDHGDSVFGSIYFMAPEQFERTPLDQRTDMYSLGCVYYYCLTGQHPFDGETAPLVMTAHLQNRVTPLAELRPDLPKWLSDWVMWHVARDMNDRPPNAREALKQFLMAETEGEMAAEIPVVAPGTNGTNPSLPAGPAGPAPIGNSGPQPILPPEGQMPSVHTAAQQVRAARLNTGPVAAQSSMTQHPTGPVVAAAPVQAAPAMAASGPVTAAQPAVPGITGATSVGLQTATSPLGVSGQLGLSGSVEIPEQSGGLSNTAKAIIGAVLAVALGLAIIVFLGGNEERKDTERLNNLLKPFNNDTDQPQDIPVTKEDLDTLLKHAAVHRTTKKNERPTLFSALKIAVATDSTDVDARIADYILNTQMTEDVRGKLLRVLQLRAQDSALPGLLQFASQTTSESSGRAALSAINRIAGPEDFNDVLTVALNSSVNGVRIDAINTLVGIVKNARGRERFITPAVSAYNAATEPSVREGLLRLLGAIGGTTAEEEISKAIEGSSDTMRLAAVRALQNMPGDNVFDRLFEFTEEQSSGTLRSEGFSALIAYLTERAGEISEGDLETNWSEMVSLAETEKEKSRIISALQDMETNWALRQVEYFIDNEDSDRIIDRAERAKERLESRLQR